MISGEKFDAHNPIPYGQVTGDFSDKVVNVIGAGPSLSGFNFDCLDGYTIGANKSAFVTNSDVLFSMDWKFVDQMYQEIEEFPGEVYITVMAPKNCVYIPGAVYLKSAREGSLSTDPTLTVGLNSGYGALNIALLKNARKIRLLGFDMKLDTQKHFHGGYPWDKSKGASFNAWARRFKHAKTKLDEKGVEVINYVGPKGSGLKDYFQERSLKDLDPEYPQ